MTVAPPRGRAAETAARKERIVEAATALAAEGGYEAVQMRDVAARAGVALATLYRHFASKDQLLLAVLAEQTEALRARVATRPPAGDTPAARVAEVLRRGSRALQRRPLLAEAMVRALSSPDAGAAAESLGVYEQLRGIIALAVDGDDVDDLDAILRTLGHVWSSVLVAWVGGLLDGPAMVADLEAAARVVLSGVTVAG